jgi:Arc/MetJ family transcription regulator
MFKEMLRMANVDVDKTSVGDALRRAVKAVPGVAKVAELLPREVRGDGPPAQAQADVDVVEERSKGSGGGGGRGGRKA